MAGSFLSSKLVVEHHTEQTSIKGLNLGNFSLS